MSVLKIKDQNNDWIQIPTIKGDKGDPFTYADFTPEQLESLKGKDGISPTVSVASDTSEDYRLSFTDETHTVTTPNLIPEAEKIFDVYPHDTASGAVASFADGADGIPLKSCIVQIEPVQDLHGYDSPWPAGGGKNLFQTTATTQTLYGTTFTVNADGTVTVVGTPTVNINGGYSFGEVMLPAGNYKLNGNSNPNTDLRLTCYNVTTSSVIASIYNNNDLSFTLSEESVIRLYPFVSTSFSGSAITMKPMIRIASESDATFAPYENICPISGWTGCKVQRTGKNLLTYVPNKIYSPLSITLDKSRATLVKKGVTYTMSFDMQNATTWRICAVLFDLEGNRYFADMEYSLGYDDYYLGPNVSGQYYVWGSNYTAKSFVITPTDDFYAMFFFLLGDTSASTVMVNPMIELGSTATPYEPYQGDTYPITFPSSAGTVYGAYVDATGGELVVDRAMVDLGTLTWTYNNGQSSMVSQDLSSTVGNGANAICSMYKTVTNLQGAIWAGVDKAVGINKVNSTTTGNFAIGALVVKDTDYTDAATFKTAMSGVQLCYELAEPIHYPLTPVEIKTLLGQNNIWADTGDVEVTYRADTTLYIKRLTDSDTDMIADANITSGSYFMVGNDLYKATVNIASGASVIVGTNAVRISLAQALNEINA